MSEPVGPASVQYGDYKGTSALDGHMGMSDAGILEAAGLDPEEWAPVGFEISAVEGYRHGVVYAIKRSDLKGVDGLPGLAARDGAIKATRHEIAEEKREAFLGGFKRWSVVATYKGLPVSVEDDD